MGVSSNWLGYYPFGDVFGVFIDTSLNVAELEYYGHINVWYLDILDFSLATLA